MILDYADKSAYRSRPRILRAVCSMAVQSLANAIYRAALALENNKRLMLIRIWVHEWEATNADRSIQVRRDDVARFTKEIEEFIAKELAARSQHQDRATLLRNRL